MAKKVMNPEAVKALEKYRRDVKSGKVKAKTPADHIAELQEDLKAAEAKVAKIKAKIIRWEKMGKSAVYADAKKVISGMTPDQIAAFLEWQKAQ